MSTPPQDPSSVPDVGYEDDLRLQVLAREQELIAVLLVDPRELEAVEWLASERMLDEPSRAILEDLRTASRPEDLARGRADLPAISDRLALAGLDIEPEELAQLRDSAAAASPQAASDAARAAQDAMIRLDLVDNGLLEARWAVPMPAQVQQVPQLREQALAIVAEAEAVLDAGSEGYYGDQRERDLYEVPEPMYSHDVDRRWQRDEDYGRQTGSFEPEREGWQR